MNCLIVAATPIEISPFLAYFRNPEKKIPEKLTIDILISGIGLTATVYALMKQLLIKRPDVIIQAGVGGSFQTALTPGTVVAIRQDTIADQSVIELQKLKTLFDLNLVPFDQFPYSKGWLVNKSAVLKKTRLKKVKGVSVNEITTSKQKVKLYKETFNPAVESMEGAALHYVCLMENVPFIQLRSISNYIGERNKKKWDMQDSIKYLNKELIKLVVKL